MDDYLGRAWIINAIDCGSLSAIAWMVFQGVALSFVDDEGYSPLLAAVERTQPDRDDVLDLLLRHGAASELHGINFWTAAHMAASRDDVQALRVLKKHRVNLHQTRIDHTSSTPLEDARTLGCWSAVAFLEQNEPDAPAATF